jgi:TIR domain/NACHT domain
VADPQQVEIPSAPKLLISYSHDSPEHEDRVREGADRLRADGVDAWIDQYSPAPPQGWPMWMGDRIKNSDFVLLVCTETYLGRVEAREEPGKGRGVLWEAKLIFNLMYEADGNVQKFIPVLFADGQPSFIPLPLAGLDRYQVDTARGYEDLYRHLTKQPRHRVPALGEIKLLALPPRAPVSYPASLSARPATKPNILEQRSRHAVIKRVRHDWIEGVLDQSLYKVAPLKLGLSEKPELVEQPLNAVIQVPDREPRPITGIPISQVFGEHNNALLIVGAPGTGKTTLLLELARDLLLRAESDESEPIPVVFNLSSWAVRREPLLDWLVFELNERLDVPEKLARQWLETEQILPLLDGLDEVAEADRNSCVEAINGFRRGHGLLPIAVCSRIADYKALGTKLRLTYAVEVQALTKIQVEEYLQRVGERMRGLHAALAEDPVMWEVLETPLMLWVGMLAYREETLVSEGSSLGTIEQGRSRLLKRFVEAMFRRKGDKLKFSRDQTTRWLYSLAQPDDPQPDNLLSGKPRLYLVTNAITTVACVDWSTYI